MFVFNCSLNRNNEEDPSKKSSEALLFNSFKELSKAVLRYSEVLNILQLDQRFNLFVSGERFFIFQRFSSSFDLSWSLPKYRLLVGKCGKL